MTKELYRQFPVDIYKRGVLVYFGSADGLRKYIHRVSPCYDKDVDDILEATDGAEAVTSDVRTDVIVYAEQVPTIPVLLHELSHATHFIMEQVGIETSTCNEAYAYLFEYLVRQVFKWLNVSCDAPLQLSSDET